MGEDDTVEGLRRKVASAMGLPEDSFCMSFGDEALGEGADMTQLSAGDNHPHEDEEVRSHCRASCVGCDRHHSREVGECGGS